MIFHTKPTLEKLVIKHTMAESDLLNPVNMNGLGTELGHQNKFVMIIPIQDAIGKKFGKNLELNLTRFTIPQMQLGATQVQFKGYTIDLPTKLLNEASKEITIEYLMDETWKSYRALLAWAGLVASIVPTSSEAAAYASQTGSTYGYQELDANMFLRCRIWLLDHYKKRILDFAFNDCWISNFAELAMDVAQPGEVRHSFTLHYTTFELLDPLLPQDDVIMRVDPE